MIRQVFTFDEQTGLLSDGTPSVDSYRQRVLDEKETARREREEREALEHPGLYL